MKRPRVVICNGCGDKRSLKMDRPDAVELPPDWKRTGQRGNRWIILCPDCYRAEVTKSLAKHYE